MIKRIHHKLSKSAIAATTILIGCILYIICSVVDQASFDDYRASVDHHVKRFLQFGADPIESPEPELAVNGQIYKLHGDSLRRDLTWYKVLSSRRLQLNMAPYRWKACKKQADDTLVLGENKMFPEKDLYLGDAGFTFHVPDAQDPSKVLQSKYLRFRLEPKDDRSCMWNYSKSCLAGGNLVMKFGKTAHNMRHPGEYKLKTNDGPIRILAYNTNRACSRIWQGQADSTTVASEEKAEGISDVSSMQRTPIDYIREGKSSTVDPEACETWLNDLESEEDLFAYNSDLSTVQIETPWMSIIIQVHQNKVATESICRYAKMNIWITSVSPDFGFSEGIQYTGPQLMEYPSLSDSDESIAMARALSNNGVKYVEAQVVDGPFAE